MFEKINSYSDIQKEKMTNSI